MLAPSYGAAGGACAAAALSQCRLRKSAAGERGERGGGRGDVGGLLMRSRAGPAGAAARGEMPARCRGCVPGRECAETWVLPLWVQFWGETERAPQRGAGIKRPGERHLQRGQRVRLRLPELLFTTTTTQIMALCIMMCLLLPVLSARGASPGSTQFLSHFYYHPPVSSYIGSPRRNWGSRGRTRRRPL